MISDLKDRNICIITDEATHQNKPAIIVSLASLDDAHKKHEFHVKYITKGKSTTADIMFQAIKEALEKLYGKNAIKKNQHKVLVLITDAAGYMIRVGKDLKKKLLKDLTHVTCVTHGLALVCEEIRKHHPKLGKFVSLMKRVMCQSTARQEIFRNAINEASIPIDYIETLYEWEQKEASNLIQSKEILGEILSDPAHHKWENLLVNSKSSDIWSKVWGFLLQKTNPEYGETFSDLPPHPVNTRFATWIVVISYYHHYWYKTVNYIRQLDAKTGRDEEDKTYISQLIAMLNDAEELKEEIDYLFDLFHQIPVFVCKTEKEDLTVTNSNKIIETFRAYLQKGAAKEANGPILKNFTTGFVSKGIYHSLIVFYSR